MSRLLRYSLILAALAGAPACFAQSTNTLAFSPSLPDMGLSIVRAVAALAIVLAIFFAGIWLFRNGQRFAWRKSGAPKLAIMESRALGNRYSLYVVAYEQQRMLIGSSPAGISLLSQLPPGAEVNSHEGTSPQPVSFAQSLQQMLRRK